MRRILCTLAYVVVLTMAAPLAPAGSAQIGCQSGTITFDDCTVSTAGVDDRR